uniref:E1 ubiquitin-activating enzyme n=1 Tax=Paramormyrops kingsleyae TaxID=1676925 RepID=A0A3B3SSI9_9TELE
KTVTLPLPDSNMAADSMDIDDSLYSRQRYVLGDSAMHRMAQSYVFLSGLGGVGVEIAKNIVLAGVKAVTVHDTKLCETWNLGTNFFIREEDVLSQMKRVEAVHSRIAALNPYVQVSKSSCVLDEGTDLSFLKKYQCVILTEASLALQKKVNNFCHSQEPPIKFISCDVFGICTRVFCDFGEAFEVSDPTGEEPKQVFVQNITQDNPGVVTCLDNQAHGLQTGQSVVFREVYGMTELNGACRQITVLTPYSFAIGDTSRLRPYAHGGFFVQVKTPRTYSFAPLQIHAALLALDSFQQQHGRLPATGLSQITEICAPVNRDLVHWLSRTARGCLPPLCAAIGGTASQEALKALTGKFAPLQQWLYLDAIEVVRPLQSLPAEEFAPKGDRYDPLRACIGETMCRKLHGLKVFMVGCGAIGCEMLKNFALLGVGLADSSGEICITDPDLIEKSNLNRQFLFRPRHIQKPKSITAAEATLEINPRLQIDAHLNKVWPASESIYSDAFYSRLDVVVTALDNVEARRYVDSRAVSNQKPLLDSGTMGTKGHTEIIVPNLTESYNSHRDPPEEEIPFCTLKSFPAVIEHTIQWARDKFESAFSHKPSVYNMFWQTHSSAEQVLQESLEGSFQVIKLLNRRPNTWDQCVTLARLKFDKYFKRKVRAKTCLTCSIFLVEFFVKYFFETGLFWQSPKRPPAPIEFDLQDFLNVKDGFCRSGRNIGSCRPPPPPSTSLLLLFTLATLSPSSADRLQMSPILFEKDDDSNGHMDFVVSASTLRAHMYSIEAADRLQTKRIAGKIIPAIATATAAVAGLVAVELIKVVGGYDFESFKNCFFNLAIPVIVFTETAQVKKTQIRDNISFSIWDRWTVYGQEDFTLSDFMNGVREKYGIEPTMVVHGVKMLYVPVMPGHNKRLKLTMQKLVKPSPDRKYVDLTVSFAPEQDGDEDLPGPPVRYYFNRDTQDGRD